VIVRDILLVESVDERLTGSRRRERDFHYVKNPVATLVLVIVYRANIGRPTVARDQERLRVAELATCDGPDQSDATTRHHRNRTEHQSSSAINIRSPHYRVLLLRRSRGSR